MKPTTDEAELAFQEAEEASEKAAGDEARRAVVEMYRRALALRSRFPAARLGLARVLLALNETEDALAEIAAARRARPVYPEASAVEGRILRATADDDAAIASYRRAIREGRGFQPEAYAGLGIVLEEAGDYEGAAEAFSKAVAQLSDTEPVLYNLLGAAYEKLEKWKEALAAYEKYLELAPEGKFASAIRSIIDQLRLQASGQESAPPIP
jgi:tetratricopeptide (TPR) repeat protein